MKDSQKKPTIGYKQKFMLKEMEVNSLLEITQAINNNITEGNLYKIYEFTIRANLNINQLLLIVKEGEDWNRKVVYGVDSKKDLVLDKAYMEIDEITPIHNPEDLMGFDWVLPVKHKNQMLAVVLLSQNNDPLKIINITFLQAITNIVIVAIENKRLARIQLKEESFRKELEIAKEVQKLLFPTILPYNTTLKVHASYLPHHSIGGDYYDYIPINKNQFLICIADVSGKGIPAALIMSNFQASLHTLLRQTSNLIEIIEVLNLQIMENAKGEHFITFFSAIYNSQLNSMVYINSGHNPPFLRDNKTGNIIELTKGSTVLGAFDKLPFINEGYIKNLEAFTFFSYTDGLTEAENSYEKKLGKTPLKKYFIANHMKPLPVIHTQILEIADTFKGSTSYKDDITIFSCKVESK